MSLPTAVRIIEVGPRDGLQNAPPVSIETKLKLIHLLEEAGLKTIEAGAFVSPKRVPQMADSIVLFQQLERKMDVCYTALTPNLQGVEDAIQAGLTEVAVFGAASESFSQKNINCSIAQSLERFAPVVEKAKKHEIRVRGYVSCVMGCPYQGEILPEEVSHVCEQMLLIGCDEISLGDTIGTGTPGRTHQLMDAVLNKIPVDRLGVHFHDTFGQALANIYVALQYGVSTIDSAVSGLGGCPYAPGAAGNVATEDVIYMLQDMGIETGVHLGKLAKAGWFISDVLNTQPTSKVSNAMRAKLEKQE
ncbi:hydroxymethylglutaryl-CoA lyase [Algicola sagamiensis]|uniref:hydroxymethylglutaryl-CoA lyase n=1 Tax=Algicola sagamiensis TaxID=163869 RepID=UPI0003718BA5|nr:hydroxymethylglutaryl-CoA lyase [Algicola sagamiensis]